VHDDRVEPGMPARYVLRDERSRQVDLHVLEFKDGDGWQTLPDGGRGRYPGSELGFVGRIGGADVPCISPALQLRHHLGYEPTERDRHDLQLLAETFGLELPPELEV
jgi:lincosamide nucleotidyltransferase A/C/D/E